MKNAMLQGVKQSESVELRGLDYPGLAWLSPKHNENIRDMIHPGPVHEFGFFISSRHE